MLLSRKESACCSVCVCVSVCVEFARCEQQAAAANTCYTRNETHHTHSRTQAHCAYSYVADW